MRRFTTFSTPHQTFPRSPAPTWTDSEFLRTGDLCRVDTEGLLYVEGRIKDLVIVAGRNFYPQVNERTFPGRETQRIFYVFMGEEDLELFV